MDPSIFRATVESLLADGRERKLIRPGVQLAIVLKHNQPLTSELTLDHFDLMEFDLEETVGQLRERYETQQSINDDIVLQYDFEEVNDAVKAKDLMNSSSKYLALRAVRQSIRPSNPTSRPPDTITTTEMSTVVPRSKDSSGPFSLFRGLRSLFQKARSSNVPKSSPARHPYAAPSTHAQQVDPENENLSRPQPSRQPRSALEPFVFDAAKLCAGRPVEFLENCVKDGRQILKIIEKKLRDQPSHGSSELLKSINKLQNQATHARTVIGIYGNTGAGKSSLINALLGFVCIVPTSGMRACTAVVTEISYNHDSKHQFKADIDFIEREVWEETIRRLIAEIVAQEGTLAFDRSTEKSDAGIAYAQVHAVYPWVTPEVLQNATASESEIEPFINNLMQDDCVQRLGTTVLLESNVERDFEQALKPFIDTGGEIWPLLKVVRLYVDSEVLDSGVTLVDLPGTRDSNPARAAIADEYLVKCDQVWIVSPITRAVNDESAKKLLGTTFRRQLQMDGGYSSVTYILSKSDDISVDESLRSEELQLALDKTLVAADEELLELRQQKKATNDRVAELKRNIRDLERDVRSPTKKMKTGVSVKTEPETPRTPSGKRKRPEPRQLNSRKSVKSSPVSDVSSLRSPSRGVDDLEPEFQEEEDDLASLILEKQTELINVKAQVQDIDCDIDRLASQRVYACIAARNQYTKQKIPQDFIEGLKKLDLESAKARGLSEEQPESMRNYEQVAAELKVFCVSSKAYQALQGLLQDDVPRGFSEEAQTEVPALQAHCVAATHKARVALSKNFLAELFQLLSQVHHWACQEHVPVSALIPQLQPNVVAEGAAEIDKLRADLMQCINSAGQAMNATLQTLFQAFNNAAHYAALQAPRIVQGWDDNIMWQSWNAAIRKNGIHRTGNAGALDFNEDLTMPFLSHLAQVWEMIFETAIPGLLRTLLRNLEAVLVPFREKQEQNARDKGVSENVVRAFSAVIGNAEVRLGVAIDGIKSRATFISREHNRKFGTRLEQDLHPIFQSCSRYQGKGSIRQKKTHVAGRINAEKDTMYRNAGAHVEQLLSQALQDALTPVTGLIDELLVNVAAQQSQMQPDEEIMRAANRLPDVELEMRQEVQTFIAEADRLIREAIESEENGKNHAAELVLEIKDEDED